MDTNLLALGGGIGQSSIVDRRLLANTNCPNGPPGTEDENQYDAAGVKQQQQSTSGKEMSRDPRLKRRVSRSASPPPARRRSSSSDKQRNSVSKDSTRDLRAKRLQSRSKSPVHRRRRSSSSSSTEKRRRRFDDRGGRNRSRRSRSRDRPRSPFSRRRRDRSRSRDRFRNRRNNWSPMGNKKGPVSPPPPMHQPGGGGNPSNPFNPMNQIYDGGYNNYQSYGQSNQQQQPQQQYGSYDYGMQMQPQQAFNGYAPPPVVMQPIQAVDDFQQAPPSWNEPPPSMHPMVSGQAPVSIQSLPPLQPQQVPPTTLLMQPQQQPQPQVDSDEEKKKREAAVAREKKTQLATLRKQRDEYKRRSNALTRELKILKEQRTELMMGNEPPSPTTKTFLKENDRLQLQIEKKIGTIENVIEMLAGIIGTAGSPSPSPPPRPPKIEPIPPPVVVAPAAPIISRNKKSPSEDDSSPERLKTKVMESIKRNKVESKLRDAPDMRRDVEPYSSGLYDDQKPAPARVNYVHYDPEMHWCQTCQVFPKTAKDFLTHLHSKDHQQMQKTLESPWHEQPINDEMPTYPDAPTKRTPIRGLQFFVPTTGWYCKICFIWMGDLHCASLHLKSQTHAQQYQEYAAQNPSFEVDWMSDRQRAYEIKLESNSASEAPPFAVPPIPRAAIAPSVSISDGIPLQIQVKSHASPAIPTPTPPSSTHDPVDEKRQKKKKRKQDERKEKRKKKRSKKRKHQSSSSSSSSDSSDTDADASPKSLNEKSKEEASQSIRVAMRNLLKQQNEEKKQMVESGGKWTVVQQPLAPVPPPPVYSANGTEAKKKDDLMISQWNEPPPVIDDNERKLLEQLKGKLKNRSVERESAATAAEDRVSSSTVRREESREDRSSREKRISSRDHSRDHSRDRTRDRSHDRVRERSRDRSRGRSRDRSRERSRGRYERGRGRRSRSRGRRSISRSRSRSAGRYGRRRSRSRSYHRSRVEKPIVRYPEFRPRVPEPEPKKKRDEDGKSEKKLSMVIKKQQPTPALSSKKLPFIGRMPVFKKQNTEEELRREEQQNNVPVESTQTAYTQPVGAQQTHHHQHQSMYHYDGMHQMAPEDYDNLMPDPMQFVSMMGAPPPPPMVPPPQPEKDEPVLPPGIDEADAAQVIKTISDAPLPRKGPLPQDFQDALSIIFPGDRKPEDDDETTAEDSANKVTPLPDPSIESINATPSIIAAPLSAEEILQQQQEQQAVAMQLRLDEQSQQSMDLYSAFAVVNGVAMLKSDHLAATSYAEDVDIPSPLPVTQVPLPPETDDEAALKAEEEKAEREAREAELKAARQAELDDLAMLGIDADDLAAQCM